MEVHFSPELEKKLNELAGRRGCDTGELVQDVMAAYAGELEEIRKTLDSRYDDLESGRVKLIDGEEVRREMQARNQSMRERCG